MAILGASKFLSFATLLAMLLLLINSALGTAAQPTMKQGRKLLQPSYGGYAGGGRGRYSTRPYSGYVPYSGRGGYAPYSGRRNYSPKP